MDMHMVISGAAVVSSPADLAVLLRGLRQRHARSRRAPVLSYRELAARTGWSHGIIGAYLTGKVLPPVDRLDELGRQLGAAPAELGALATARERVADQRACPPAGPPRQLPAAVPGFVGRTALSAMLDVAAAPPRATIEGDPETTGGPVVLSGPAGIGKTALAVHWARRSAALFPDGQLWADLRGSGPRPADPAVVLDRFLISLGGSVGGGLAGGDLTGGSVGETAYRTVLAQRRVLVVLDDAAGPDQVRPLLPGGSGCRTLVTSRARLTALVAIDGAQPLAVDPMDRNEARRLLAARLGPDRIAEDPAGTDAVLAASAGLPLALAVAAARVLTQPGIDLLTVARELAAGDLPADGDWNRITEIDRLSTGRGG
ncbi:hypothetical protein Q0Z83_011290 [Actinoplanes sichuanensis]|uniref:NB-ARC domain-containing protein n=1 Tax=Actinoplanes sichuanensis TaxID=512349 RepID=A0ABW4AQY4_9ACTN|nr:helix-turn-helix transcriptional regulator [Actinoplanes sichuanensis]BEL02938.1 hypothetical protein Q0Z83_011290 [Actinoplanes sichuanensis]